MLGFSRRLGGLAALLLLLSSCTSTAGAGTTTFTVGAIYPLAGPQAAGGQQELSGVELALQIARQRGLLGDRRVRLLVRSVITPTQAARAVDALVRQDHVNLILGTYGSTLAVAAAARADQLHVVYWETGAVADPVTEGKQYVFRTVAAGSTLGREAADFTAYVLIPRNRLRAARARAVVVYVDDVYGRSVAAGDLEEARADGIPVVGRIAYDVSGYDPAAIAARVKALHPDFLWDVSYLDDGVAIWRQMALHKVRLVAAIGTSSAFCQPAFGQRLGQSVVGLYAADKPDQDINPAALAPAARSLFAQARTLYVRDHPGQSMQIPVVAGFVGGWTLFTAVMGKLSSNSTAAIRAAAFAVDIPVGGVINGGGVRFGRPGTPDAGQNQLAAAVIGQWQLRQGRLEMAAVYPAGYAEWAPQVGPLPMDG